MDRKVERAYLEYFRPHRTEGVAAMKATLAVLADYANVTQDGKLYIMGIFHEVNAPFLPFPLPQMFLVASFKVESAEYGKEQLIRLALRDKNGGDAEMLYLEGQAQAPQPTSPASTALAIHRYRDLFGV